MRVQWRPLGNGWEATIGDCLGLGGFSEVHGGACGTWRLARRMGVAAARVLAREDDRRSPWLPGVPADPEPPASLTATAAAHVRTYLRLEAMFRASALAELLALAERADLAAITRAIEAMEVRG